MKSVYSCLVIFLTVINGFGQITEFEWAGQWGSPPNTTDAKTRLVSCTDGSFYMSGEFVDTAFFIDKRLVSEGGTDLYLVKYSAQGMPQWSVRIGGNDDEYVQELVCDEDGNVVIAGYFYGTTQIGNDEYVSFGSQDIFIAKLNEEGDFLWSKRIGGPMADYFHGLSLDPELNFFVAGHFYNEIAIGDTTLIGNGSSDIFIAKFNPDGDLQWANASGGSSSDQISSSGCDPSGNLLVTGSFYYDFTISDTTLTTIDPVGVFIAKYHPDGQLESVIQLNGTYLNTDVCLSAASSGDFYISGNFSEQITFGDEVFVAGEFNQDIYLARYDGDFNLQWAKYAHSYSSDQVVDIETDAAGNVYVAGHYLDTIHFDDLTLNYTLCCGSREIFIVKYDASGNIIWGDTISGARANLQSIELTSQEELLLSGLFSEEVRMGSLSLSYYNGFKNYITSLQTNIYTSVRPYEQRDITALIYPNPVSDILHLRFSGEAAGEYSISSASGQLVMKGVLLPEGIDISKLPAGQYIINLFDSIGVSSQGLPFIKN
jgi:hypothetical protein